jgi:hypothetical protein
LICVGAGDKAAVPLPIHITTWEGTLGYSVRAAQIAPSLPGEMRLRFAVHRTGAVAFFGVAVCGAMVILGPCALTIGTLVFIGVRKIEVTLIGAVGAIVFALPTLRNALAGSPPLGVRADVMTFFWAALVAVFAPTLFVSRWARSGAPSDTI